MTTLLLREKCPYLETLWSAFSRIWTEYGPEKLQIRTLFTQYLSTFATTVPELSAKLESEVIISWLKKNEMVANPDTFPAITLGKRKSDHTNERITVDNQQVKVVSGSRLNSNSGSLLNDKLNFNLHICNI